ncbi:MAG: hypothetical protein K9J37_16730 [Saprospiraceae bacterium]|nr:hypothetical protein [Saprospiraceae bacterium]MCF8251561.1 hypothetical protein [Saprospiraceae bacterium]MCF8310929.1 hypothetical protein [Saprospiraceae bacterium]MCF8439735.1 hypothetical protein [Saprospiraceae bacterium]
MKRNFAAALQDDSQQAINAYLRADQAEMDARWSDDINRYKSNPIYLGKAASLLGEKHVLYNQLVAKQYYFEGLIKRLEGGKTGDTTVLNQALALELKALELDSGAAYVYNEIGLIYDEIRKPYRAAGNEQKQSELFQKQIDNYEVAMELAPKWVMPYHNAGQTYREWRRLEKAENMELKAISLDSNLVVAYSNLMLIYYFSNKYESCINVNKKLLQIKSDESAEWSFAITCSESLLGHLEESLIWLEKAIILGVNYNRIQEDTDLEELRKTSEFESLMKKYFPNKKR